MLLLGSVITVYTVNADFGDSPLPVDGGFSVIRIPAKRISPECWKDWTPNELDSFMTWGLRIMQTTSRIWLILHVWQPEFLDVVPLCFQQIDAKYSFDKNTNSHTQYSIGVPSTKPTHFMYDILTSHGWNIIWRWNPRGFHCWCSQVQETWHRNKVK